MGACLGRCFNSILERLTIRQSSPYQKQENVSDVQPEEILVEQNHRVPVTLEMMDESGWPGRSNRYTRLSSKNESVGSGLDNPLQTLDAKELFMHHGLPSTSASSIDLEWEHEGLPLPTVENEKEDPDDSLSEPSIHNSQPSSLTASPWSRVSTPNSLEWDPAEADIVDVDTENLLTEIERLTDRALKETGEWTNTS